MSPIFGGSKTNSVNTAFVDNQRISDGWRFTLKGSPRHYEDVVEIIERSGDAEVYFGEALTYERGAGVALWRIRANGFRWLPELYAWWAEQERIEPVRFTMHLYLPPDTKHPVLDLRDESPTAVEHVIRDRAPRD
ncbi:MAG: hypothetical protein ACR2J8_03155 [Thermomicrobiales bacterium]